MNRRRIFKLLAWTLGILLIIGLAAPAITVDQYARRLQTSLEHSLGRRVELRDVHFSLFKGPGFSIGRVVIHEDPSIGIEPVAYIEDPGSMVVAPSIRSLLGGKFTIASISLNEASINITKTGPAAEWGRWNFASLISPSLIRTAPAIHVRKGRIHFKFGDTKSVFYLTETDLDLSPASGGDWRIALEGQPARTDRPMQGLGSLRLRGRWYASPGRADMDLAIEHTNLGEITALLAGQDAGVHGILTARVHFAGPLNNLGMAGRLAITDVHRWDMMPGNRQGWPLDLSGRLDLIGQKLELHSASTRNSTLPLSVHFRATDYLSQPHWAVALNWNRFSIAPILDLARHMGAQIPPKLQMSGVMDGAIGYSALGWQGGLSFHDAVVTVPDSPPVRFDQAYVVFDHGHARLFPALVRGENDEARIEADWSLNDEALDLEISTDGMKVQSLRAQVALANVPGLDQVTSGYWSGGLRFHRDAKESAWTGRITLTDAEMPIAGFAHPLVLPKAQVRIDGARLVMDRFAASIGNLEFAGDYRYEPGTLRPHRVRLYAGTWDAADLESECMPTLRRNTNLIARTLGRPMVTDWLRQRNVDGSIHIDELLLAGERIENVDGRVLWDVGLVQLENVRATMEGSRLTGKLDVNLRGSRPTYRFAGKMKGLNWQSGSLDADGTIETFGTGLQLLTNLTVEGSFAGSSMDLGTLGTVRSASGAYNLAWSQSGPRLRLSNLSVRTGEDTFTGRGATQEDGHLLILLSNGARETRMTGTLAKLRVE